MEGAACASNSFLAGAERTEVFHRPGYGVPIQSKDNTTSRLENCAGRERKAGDDKGVMSRVAAKNLFLHIYVPYPLH